MVKTINISLTYQVFEEFEELLPPDRELILAARAVAANAYAPYSKFKVGAAIRLSDGSVVTGANVENAAFPSGLCAERSAISNAVTNYKNDFPVAMAIAAMTDEGLADDPVPPCGNCRQVIAEEEHRTSRKIKIILSGKKKTIILESIGALLPLQFNSKNLNVSLP